MSPRRKQYRGKEPKMIEYPHNLNHVSNASIKKINKAASKKVKNVSKAVEETVKRKVGEAVNKKVNDALSKKVDATITKMITTVIQKKDEEAVTDKVCQEITKKAGEAVDRKVNDAISKRVSQAVNKKATEVVNTRIANAVTSQAQFVVKRQLSELIACRVSEAVSQRVNDAIRKKVDYVIHTELHDMVENRVISMLKEKIGDVLDMAVKEALRKKTDEVNRNTSKEVAKNTSQEVTKYTSEEVNNKKSGQRYGQRAVNEMTYKAFNNKKTNRTANKKKTNGPVNKMTTEMFLTALDNKKYYETLFKSALKSDSAVAVNNKAAKEDRTDVNKKHHEVLDAGPSQMHSNPRQKDASAVELKRKKAKKTVVAAVAGTAKTQDVHSSPVNMQSNKAKASTRRLQIRQWACGHCREEFTQSKQLEKHCEEVHSCQSFLCIVCEKVCRSKYWFLRHLCSHPHCGFCDAFTSGNTMLEHHFVVDHDGRVRLGCRCGRVSCSWDDWKKHEESGQCLQAVWTANFV